jgi:hypothetical protein
MYLRKTDGGTLYFKDGRIFIRCWIFARNEHPGKRESSIKD